jgi:5-methylthioribose kinase
MEYLLGMSAAPVDSVVWKQSLLQGRFDVALAEEAGRLLAAIHQTSFRKPNWRDRFGDQSYFHELRLEPFYLRLPRRVPQAARPLADLLQAMDQNQRTLVHADFSPKNLLVSCGRLTLVDYETVHFGDPAFDLGFFLAHLTLKTIHLFPTADGRPMLAKFWSRYLAEVDFEPAASLIARGCQHLAAILWVRLAGVSPVDYLVDPVRRRAAEHYGDWLWATRPSDLVAMQDGLDAVLQTIVDGGRGGKLGKSGGSD